MAQLLHHKAANGMEIAIARVRQFFDLEKLGELLNRQGAVDQPRPIFALSRLRLIIPGLFRRNISNDRLKHILQSGQSSQFTVFIYYQCQGDLSATEFLQELDRRQ